MYMSKSRIRRRSDFLLLLEYFIYLIVVVAMMMMVISLSQIVLWPRKLSHIIDKIM